MGGDCGCFPPKSERVRRGGGQEERVGKEEGESRGMLGKEERGKGKQTFPQRDFQKAEKDLAEPFPNHPGV